MKNALIIGLTCLCFSILEGCGGGSSTPPPPPPPPSVTVSPSSATVPLNRTALFTATGPTATPPAVNWSQTGTPGGILEPSGNMVVYTAPFSFTTPPTPNSPATVTVTATLQSDPTKSSSGIVTIVYPNDNSKTQTIPIKLGTTGGNSTDISGNKCCSGTLGCLVSRGGTLFILSNNHVLDKSDQGTVGDPITQPGLADNNCVPGINLVAHLTQAAALKPSPCSPAPCTGPAPSNVDAAIAQVVAGQVDLTGNILDLGAAGPSSIAAAPPSATVAVPATVLANNEGVAKSGRTSGLTCSTLLSFQTGVSVDYDSSCAGAKAFTATFNNQVIINGGNFSATGDSGALVVTSDTARPLALLYGGNSASTTANPIQDIIGVFTNASGTPVIVGGADHAVSCAPTASGPVANPGGTASSATLTVEELQRATATKDKFAAELMRDPAITGVGVGVSADNPKEAALVIFVTGPTIQPIPAQIEGVRTKVILGTRFTARSQQATSPAPGQTTPPAIVLNLDDIKRAITVKDAHADALMHQGGIMGVGVGRSDDNPAEPALVIFVEKGMLQSPIPPEIDGVRTKIIEGDRFHAFGCRNEPKSAATCSKVPARNPTKR